LGKEKRDEMKRKVKQRRRSSWGGEREKKNLHDSLIEENQKD